MLTRKVSQGNLINVEVMMNEQRKAKQLLEENETLRARIVELEALIDEAYRRGMDVGEALGCNDTQTHHAASVDKLLRSFE